jgi:glutathione synthase/RimK-type ligase-like ATP-grasp enzyme
MNINLIHLIQASHALGLQHTIIHESGNLVAIHHQGRTALFAGYSTPLNDHTTAQICQDKEFFYQITKPLMPLPRTRGYLNPDTSEKHRPYLHFSSIEAIATDILEHFALPVIIKKNRGSTGTNVFLCRTTAEIQSRLHEIFNRSSYKFDYIALAQEYITIAHEYRVIYLDGKLAFAYEKDIEQATFVGNLSRLHWEGARAVLVEQADLLERFRCTFAGLFETLPLRFCGLDVAIDINDKLWLIEANSAPGFGYFVADGGGPRLVQFYCEMLKSLFEQ